MALSLILSLTGAAFLIGGVAAVLTQWLTQTLAHLSEGRATVPWRGHFVVVGWTDRTPHVVARLLEAEPRQRVVVLVEDIGQVRRAELRAALPHRRLLDRVVARVGAATRPEHLARAGCARARAVVVPELDAVSGRAREHGPRWLRGLVALRRALEAAESDAMPRVVVELGRRELAANARALLPEAELVEGDAIAARAIVRDLRLDSADRDGLDVAVVGAGGGVEELVAELRRRAPRVGAITVVAPRGTRLDHPPGEQGPALRVVEVDPEAERPLVDVDLGQFDRAVLVADRGGADPERADESTLATAIGLSSRAGNFRADARAVVELLDPASAGIFTGPLLSQTITPREVGHALAERALGQVEGDGARAAE